MSLICCFPLVLVIFILAVCLQRLRLRNGPADSAVYTTQLVWSVAWSLASGFATPAGMPQGAISFSTSYAPEITRFVACIDFCVLSYSTY